MGVRELTEEVPYENVGYSTVLPEERVLGSEKAEVLHLEVRRQYGEDSVADISQPSLEKEMIAEILEP